MPSMSSATPVQMSEQRFVLDDQALKDLAPRLVHARLPTDLGMGWEQGVPSGWLRDLLDDWQEFDPGALQRQLDGLRQFRAEVDGQGLHVVVAEGRGPEPMPVGAHAWLARVVP
jgi:Epoxide hydrolase N terminus